MGCVAYFERLWEERREQPGDDLVSMLVHGEATKDMTAMQHLGNLLLLIVGGNDTTRNTMSGSVYSLNRFPDQYDKLIAEPDLMRNAVSEIIRWQSPVAHMCRTALQDTEIRGQKIAKHDKICMWYISGNRDEEVIENPDAFIIDRENPRNHISFGFGIHRCMGNRVAEAQLRIVWEEILKRFERLEVVGEPERIEHSFVHGIKDLQVIAHPNS